MRRLLLFAFLPALHAQQTITVCDAIIKTHDRQEVTIRGLVVGEPHHGYWLVSSDVGPAKCPGWREWIFSIPAGIGIAASKASLDTPENIAVLEELLNRSRVHGYLDPPVPAIVTGTISKKPWPFVHVRRNGTTLGTGVGQAGEAAAVVEMRAIHLED